MNLKLMSWNVRGANDVNKRRIIKSVVRKQKVDLMCIQGTKIQLMTDGVVKSLGVGRFLEWRTIEAAGAAGGVLVFGIKGPWNCWSGRRANSQFLANLELWKMGQSGCSRVYVAPLIKMIESVFGMILEQSEAFGVTHGV